MEDLPGELILCITDYLPYVDIVSLRQACSSYYNCVPLPEIRKMLVNKLSAFSSDAEKIMQEIDETGVVVAGSFILSLLCGGSWQPGDIDIYEQVKGYYNINYEKMPFCSKLLSFSGMEYVESNVYEHISSYITRVYRCGGLSFNHIPVSEQTPMRFIYHSFDMDLVKVAYRKGKLYVKDWNKLIARKDYIIPSSLVSFSEKSCIDSRLDKKKYERVVRERMLTRKEKYNQRGFLVEETRKTKEIIKRNLNVYSVLMDKNKEIMEHLTLFHFNDYLNPKV
ncbi:F-box domain-containing protein [Cedratvirus Zaza IHUMI]|uniref:F-box domain-containing protein n=1 Tax=Cedratvirus Zaza IHUMI TaxID=2126979 RepID=A0A2R8FFW2_9VIRU|nr:F-box domain-containing protein [Cedratvirus Zaza IHUMI]